jgi:hypothetical protein
LGFYLNYDAKFRAALQSHQGTMGVEFKWFKGGARKPRHAGHEVLRERFSHWTIRDSPLRTSVASGAKAERLIQILSQAHHLSLIVIMQS